MSINKIELSQYLHNIKDHPEFGRAFVHYRYIPPVEAQYGPRPRLNRELSRILEDNGISNLYNHQVDAIEEIRRGENIIISTPTASGKSLIYNLSVLETLLSDEKAKALYVFPLKALEQDQLKNLSAFLKEIREKKISADIYDGDTSPYRRKKIRTQPPEIIFTNPDMLHHGIMAYHEKWKELFENLSFVILDEVHTYRGIFGSHMNQIIKRLKRICGLYRTEPRFILLSATINNPGPFGESLIQDRISVIDSSGSPRSGQYFLFLNPDTSPNFLAARLFAHCIQSGFRTIAFTQSRKAAELIHVWTSQLSPRLGEKVSSYRAGFMPKERREIEKRLAKGDLLGVVSTSALEMGIDIGYLDVCLLVGYPGTIINTWQRGGRVGRSGRESMVILIAKPDALDQYFMKRPDDLFGRSYEAAILDPNNPYVIEAHLPCAAHENPVTIGDKKDWGDNLSVHLEKLEMEGKLTRTADNRKPIWYSTKSRPHGQVDIRSGGSTYTIFEKETGQAIGSIDGIRAFKECHPGSIYLHMARQYLVDSLDIDKKDIVVHRSDLNYFTLVRAEKDTEIIKVNRSRPEGQFIVREGVLKVTEKVVGYEKRAMPGQELMGVFPLELPQQTFETIGFWVEIEPVINRLMDEKGLHLIGGIHAIEHAMIGIFPLFALCDRNDIGGICYTYHPQVEKSAIFIYDGYPGGVGLAQRGYEVVFDLLQKTLDHVRNCECDEGCPSCIHSPKCGSGNKPLDKAAAVTILDFLLGRIPLDMCYDSNDKPALDPQKGKRRKSNQNQSEIRILYFDLETQKLANEVGGWGNTHLMKVSVAVIYDSFEESFFSFTEDMVSDLVTYLKRADLIVGFNIKKFDYDVLSAYTGSNLSELPTFDILEDIHNRLGFRLGLDHLAKETLGHGKSADGIQAVEWFRHGEMKKLTDYCRQDVIATRDLFLYGLENGNLIYRTKRDGNRVRLLVDWNLENILRK
ncbi:DEAD/DEAH box helicase [Deltaproteobacteria bacterium]|nr:DEAD/DEAH box helicase [Deltaproteobacteria bacterium]